MYVPFKAGTTAPALLVGLALGLAGCGVDPRPASWEYIAPVILAPSCATSSCHSRAAAVAGLDFSNPERAYISLTRLKVWVVDPNGTAGCMRWNGTTVVCQRGFRPLVTPFNAEQSRIVNMLRARGAARMPPDRPLPEADIRLIEKWIRNGAYYREPGHDAGAEDGGPTVVVVTVAPPDPFDAGEPPDADVEAGAESEPDAGVGGDP
jgi:hypothetical protein